MFELDGHSSVFDMEQILKDILKPDQDENISIAGFYSNFPLIELVRGKDVAIAYGRSDHLWAHLIGKNPDELNALLAKNISKTKYYYSVEDSLIPLLSQYGEIEWIMRTKRYILDENVSIPKPDFELRKVEPSYASQIFENSEYQDFTSIEYIKGRLKTDISAGVFIKRQLIAWGFCHDDGALGFLHVLYEYRNKGLGLDIVLQLVHQKRSLNKAVFCNIVPENAISQRIVAQLGFRFDREVSWLKLK
jgi:hypothetical protein